MVRAVFFCAIYLAALELGRLTLGPAGLPLFPPALPLLLFALLLAPAGTRRHRVAAAAFAHLLSAIGHGDAVSVAILDTSAVLLAAGTNAALCGRWGIDVRGAQGVAAAWRLLLATGAAAATAATVYAVPHLVGGTVTDAAEMWTARLLTSLMSILMFAPLAISGPRQMRAATRGRWLEFTALAVATAAVTQLAWASADAPRPALLAPLYVWAVVRFQLLGSVVNVIFGAVALANWFAGRGPWAQTQGLTDVSSILFLPAVASATLLVLAAGMLERRRGAQLTARVLDGVHEGIVVIDRHGDAVTGNRAAAEMFRMPAASLPGRSLSALLSPAIDPGAAMHGDIDVEVVATRADGTTFPARVSLSPLASEDERHVLVVVRDLSHQRDTERSLEMSEAQLRAVLAALPDLILIHDRDGRYVGFHVSQRQGQVVPPASILGRTIIDLLSPADAEALDAARRRVLETKAPEFVEFSVQQDGQTRCLESRLVPLGPDRTLNVLRDVTDRRQLQDQLRQAQKLEAIGRLAGGVAHDFNNLLTVIGGSTELVLDALPAADRNRRLLQEVREATARATLLTQQLLAFGRRQVLQAELFDIRQVVLGCEQMLTRLIGEHVTLACAVHDAVPSVRADRGQIEQVVVNLVINARDAMPAGGRLQVRTACVTVTEETSRVDPRLRPGRFVSLSVADTGSGIPADVIEHIFEPFYTTKTTGRGTGLGLATVYGIVQQSGGFITVDSRVDVGSTFTVYLPAVDLAPLGDAPDAPAVATSYGGHETVLLVEDEAAVRDIAVRFLTAAGYQVLPAANGQDALDLARAHVGPLHVLLTDVVMPGLSGPELATALRRRGGEMRVVFMSGYPNDALVAHQVPDESALFIQKPFSRHGLLDVLRASLETPVSES